MPAAKAGVDPGMQLIAVNGRRFSTDNANSAQVLRDALLAAIGTRDPIELLIENADYYKTYKVDYHGGEKYPHLVRDESKPDVLTDIIKAR
jgi:predicted metalloprotease with PDZ domain